MQAHLDLDDAELTLRCEQTIRNYDPCISCSAHFPDLTVDRSLRTERAGFPPRRPTLVPAIRAVRSWPSGTRPAALNTRLRDVISMRALVVYESMYGNTQVIAGNIADGLRGDYAVTLVPVAEATWDLVADADLLVAGAPTHMHGLSTRSTRRMAAQAAAK
ncbi:MAG TPA: flavodoxin domain-containing protein, partial [Streptosporangiaceae bacterium]|nr:flavodoxin domain-containing protein [Streptosporangiaceae bacterium]